ncbi:MAG: hypothetical protein JW861_08085 [Bacteroidales bacterium]|nr:hypothetical protein [Bacteroidales bacterium]
MKCHPAIIPLVLLLMACSTSRQVPLPDATAEGEDSTRYELIVFEPGFENWFLSRSRPGWFHEESYYHAWNVKYVNEWNHRVMHNEYREPYDYRIDFDPAETYGKGLEYKLYWFFKYLETKYAIRLDISSREVAL